MIRINQLKLPTEHTAADLEKKLARKLKFHKNEKFTYEIARRSIDARKKPEIFYIYTIDVVIETAIGLPDKTAGNAAEQKRVEQLKDSQIAVHHPVRYHFPHSWHEEIGQAAACPVIVGMGPAGLFCGYMLALHGFKPIILERGEAVEAREMTVEKFWRDGILNPESNVQFGEGGAGTFSDGKLNTLVKDKDGRGKAVLSILAVAGAPESILYDYKPHLGTDVLKKIVLYMRNTILEHGGEVRFGRKVTGLLLSDGRIAGVVINGREKLPASQVVLAIGHSARDTFQMLYNTKIPLEAKAFAVGLRVEHSQTLINLTQYGTAAHDILEAAAYKVVSKQTSPSVYSFCMCPGGYVVNASSEAGRTAVNGMSYSDRKGNNANSAIVVTVAPEDFGGDHPLAGIDFQRRLEEKAYEVGCGKIPVEYYGEFKQNILKKVTRETVLQEEERPGQELPEQATKAPTECEFRENVIRKLSEHEFRKKEVKELPGCGFQEKVTRELPEKETAADFMNRPSPAPTPSIKGQWCFAPVHEILPLPLNRALVSGMTEFGRRIPGFDDDGVLVSGVESRTSSPVRILRDADMQSAVKGLFPCGEGAGYAGGIMSAAMDGIRVAEAVAADCINCWDKV